MQAEWVANNKFRVYGDYTNDFPSGRRVYLDHAIGSDVICTVTSASLASSFTTVTLAESSVGANVRRVQWGIPSVGPKGALPAHTHTGNDDGGALSTSGLSSAMRYAFAFGGW